MYFLIEICKTQSRKYHVCYKQENFKGNGVCRQHIDFFVGRTWAYCEPAGRPSLHHSLFSYMALVIPDLQIDIWLETFP